MRVLRSILAATLALVVAGCGDSSTGPRADYLGTYDLTSVNGALLPAVVLDDGTTRVVVTRGDMVLAPSNRATVELTVNIATGILPRTDQSFVCTGTHARSGNDITITLTESENCVGGALDATLDGRTLTVSDESGMTLVYTREP